MTHSVGRKLNENTANAYGTLTSGGEQRKSRHCGRDLATSAQTHYTSTVRPRASRGHPRPELARGECWRARLGSLPRPARWRLARDGAARGRRGCPPSSGRPPRPGTRSRGVARARPPWAQARAHLPRGSAPRCVRCRPRRPRRSQAWAWRGPASPEVAKGGGVGGVGGGWLKHPRQWLWAPGGPGCLTQEPRPGHVSNVARRRGARPGRDGRRRRG